MSIFPLYSTSSTNFRNYLHRFIVILICVTQIVALNFKSFQKGLNDPSYFIYWYPIFLLSFLICGLISTGGYTLHECILFWKSPKLINPKMKLAQTMTT